MDYQSDLEILNIIRLYYEWKNPRQIRRWRVRPINRDRVRHGYFRKVFMSIKNVDEGQFFIHTRMTRPIYDLLFNLVGFHLEKPLQIIGAEERLSITLLYLAHGEYFQTIAWKYKIGETTARNIIIETCEILWRLLSPHYLSEPIKSQYEDIAIEYLLAERTKCWDSRDQYWKCLSEYAPEHNSTSGEKVPEACLNMRMIFESSCSKQWVKHFDRKRTYEQFKEKMAKGYDPLVEQTNKRT